MMDHPNTNSTAEADAKAKMGPDVKALQMLVQRLQQGLLERDTAARLMLLAAVAGEHVLLVGPPGTAKSELARRLQSLMPGAPYFERLLTRFSTPEELFGPLSLKALEDDRYERLVQGYLPCAGVAFLDEVFKANSAILNTLLTLLNERQFDNGSTRMNCPLVTLVGASNETPQDEALLAFHDRFLIRLAVQPVGEASFRALVTGDPGQDAAAPRNGATPSGPQPPMPRSSNDHPPALEPQQLAAWRAAAGQVGWDEAALEGLQALRGWAQAHRLEVSDRRWRQLGRLLRTAAAVEGRRTVGRFDLWLAAYVMASEPAQQEQLLTWILHEWMQAAPDELTGLTRAVEALEKQLQIESQAQAEEGAEGAGKIALARSVGGASGEGADSGMLRLLSERLEERLRRRWSPLHRQARVEQVQEVAQRTRGVLEQAQARLQVLTEATDGRLWWPLPLRERALAGPAGTVARAQALLLRLGDVETGFAGLPLDESLAAVRPAPVSLGG